MDPLVLAAVASVASSVVSLTDVLAQLGRDPVRGLLVVRGYFIGTAVLASMVYLRFRTRQRFKPWVYWGFGTVAVVFFLFATGSVSYTWPLPGVIWSVGLSLVIFTIGVATGWTLWGPEEALVRHERRHYPSETRDESGDPNTHDPRTRH